LGQKVVLWFGGGQKYQFLCCPLPPVCPVPETVLQIKHWTTEIVLSCPSFFSKSNAPYVRFHDKEFTVYSIHCYKSHAFKMVK